MSTETATSPGNSDAARGPALTASSEHSETTAKRSEHSTATVREGTDSPQKNATVPGRPAGVDHGDAAYWARIHRIVEQAPPLSDHQRATIRAALSQPKAGAA